MKQILCDKCGAEFVLQPDDIKTYDMAIKDEMVTLHYFVCPECRHIYKIAVVDKQCKKMACVLNALESQLRYATKRYGSNSKIVSKLTAKYRQAANALANYRIRLEIKYAGTFTFKEPESGQKQSEEIKIVYLP